MPTHTNRESDLTDHGRVTKSLLKCGRELPKQLEPERDMKNAGESVILHLGSPLMSSATGNYNECQRFS